MLLKIISPDMLNTVLVDVSTGQLAYQIVTGLVPSDDSESPIPSSSFALSSVSSSSSSLHQQKSPPLLPLPKFERRRTHITDVSGAVIAAISWTGRQPDIAIGEENIGGLTDLFGSNTIRFMPKILAIPTRFDTEFIWTATSDSLTLFDYDSEQTKGTFHHNVIRLPSPSKSSKSTSSFIHTRVPGLGSNYLEFEHHTLAEPVEIIVSFIMMEILRRGRFSLTPYTFERPKLWQLREAKDLVMRRLRRNTV